MAGNEDTPKAMDSESLETPTQSELTQSESTQDTEKSERIIKLPLTRIKHLVKLDPDVNLASSDAVILLAKATELFVHDLASQAYGYTAQTKRKTVQRKDLDLAIDRIDSLAFLEGCLES